jgi:DNA polymerase I-like protein with 3'-5' exonuclease and polymerase domains
MAKVLLVEAKPSRSSYDDFKFEFDRTALCPDPSIKKILKKDVTLDAKVAENYDWVILIGSEPVKFFTKKTSVMDYAGKVIDDKFLVAINPGMLSFKPEAKPVWLECVKEINKYVGGQKEVRKYDASVFRGIEDTQEALDYINAVRQASYGYFAIDCETSSLYPRNGHLLGVSLCGTPNTGAYISADCIDEDVVAALQLLAFEKVAVFHNAKFDIAWLGYHLNLTFPNFEDTMLLHYALDERQGTHGLKQLALQYTEYGDYEEPLHDYIAEYTKKHGILKADFTWALIPFDIMKEYAAIDSCVTFLLYGRLKAAVSSKPKLNDMYNTILIPGCAFLNKIEQNGVPFDLGRLNIAEKVLDETIRIAEEKLYSYPELIKFEADQGEKFNPASVQQLRKLLFDYLKLTPTGIKTATTGKDSTNVEALEILAEDHELPKLIVELRKARKIKNTYIDKIKNNLDKDGRLRTNFNLHGTTSGRLSSSGKLNLQQLPRDNPAVKGSIKAKDGYKIVSMDLKTAEVYVAAVLSQDPKLQDVFKQGGDFHSSIAKLVFKLPCEVELIKKNYPLERQAAKAVTFGILFGAGANKISQQVTKDSGTYFSAQEAQEVIDDYFKTFSKLKLWIKRSENSIKENSFVYSHFGRKRRLRNMESDNRGVVSHEVRSGVNFLIQSVSSDINLLGSIELQNVIEARDLDIRIFALVHDSIVAEVREDLVDTYKELLASCVQKNRGIMIPEFPIQIDIDVGDDYSFGKFEETYLSNSEST